MSALTDIYATSQRILAHRQHSVCELRDKLTKKYPEHPEEIEQIISEHLRMGYLNDKEFVRAFVKYKLFQKRVGTYRITQELKLKNVEEQLIVDEIQRNLEFESDVINKAACKKLRAISDSLTAKEKTRKLYDHLIRKGFASHQVRNCIESLGLY